MKNFYFIFILFFTVMFFSSCEDDFPVQQGYYSVEFNRKPEFVNLLNDEKFSISVKVNPYTLSDLNNTRVFLNVLRGEETVYTDSLFDDGNFLQHGDNVKYDGVFSNLFTASVFPDTGAFELKIEVQTEDETFSCSAPLTVISVFIPKINSVVVPAVLEEFSQDFEIEIDDNNGEMAPDSIKLIFYNDSQRKVKVRENVFVLTPVEPSIYAMQTDSSLGAGMKDEKWLRFVISNITDSDTFDLRDPVDVINTPPQILNATVPDSVPIPEYGYVNYIVMTATLYDARGQADLQEAFININDNKVNLYDDGPDGGHGDTVAGDGTYTATLTVNSYNSPETYEVEFVAVDRVGQESESIIKILTLYSQSE